MPPRVMTSLFALTFAVVAVPCHASADRRVVFAEDFESGHERWETLDPHTWTLSERDGNHTFEITARESDYKPPVRSPGHIALIKDIAVDDFELTFRVRSTKDTGNHRDCCIFFGWQDPTHFYYAHLGAKPDPASGQIMIVNDAPRTPLTMNENRVPWTGEWHQVKVVRSVSTGHIAVYFDDMDHPQMEVTDTTFGRGRIGIGSFDDLNEFDDIVLKANMPLDVWPGLAPGEITRNVGEVLPFRPQDNPRITRVVNVTRPTFTVHVPPNANSTAAVILPGGGFGKVVPDLEGTEAADWLNQHGVTAFVVSYRTTDDKSVPGWIEPLQDAQRTLSLVRSRADEWHLNPNRIGLVAFSAGGQVGARLLSHPLERTYDRIDEVDDVPFRPDFAVLVYPWNIYDADGDSLVEGVAVSKMCPPTFIVHTHDDASSSVGAALFYAGLRKQKIPAELHVYGNGGHGYGLRPVAGSRISTWPEHAAHWLGTQQFLVK